MESLQWGPNPSINLFHHFNLFDQQGGLKIFKNLSYFNVHYSIKNRKVIQSLAASQWLGMSLESHG